MPTQAVKNRWVLAERTPAYMWKDRGNGQVVQQVLYHWSTLGTWFLTHFFQQSFKAKLIGVCLDEGSNECSFGATLQGKKSICARGSWFSAASSCDSQVAERVGGLGNRWPRAWIASQGEHLLCMQYKCCQRSLRKAMMGQNRPKEGMSQEGAVSLEVWETQP
jgi:hypothetical protein